MNAESAKKFKPTATVQRLTELKNTDLGDLCDATEKSLEGGVGFSIGSGWLKSPGKERLESYWKGILLVPERVLFVGRLDGVIAGAVQLLKPPPSNQTQSFSGSIREHFVAPWARGHGLAKMLITAAEDEARELKLRIVKLEVRATQEAAIALYEQDGFKRWGELDKYEMVDGQYTTGYFYYKDLV